jgi:hypothetical protein
MQAEHPGPNPDAAADSLGRNDSNRAPKPVLRYKYIGRILKSSLGVMDIQGQHSS